jgi:hypothetical protein
MNAGDQCANDADIGAPDFTGCHVNQRGVSQQQIKRKLAQCGLHRTLAFARADAMSGHGNYPA